MPRIEGAVGPGVPGSDIMNAEKNVAGAARSAAGMIEDELRRFSTAAPPAPRASEGRPHLPMPNLSMANVALLLMGIQDKMVGQRIKTGEEGIKVGQKKMQDVHQERAQKLKEHFDKLAKSQPKSEGFFGKLFSAIKKLFTGDIKGAWDDFTTAFKENIVSAVFLTLSIVTMNPVFLIGLLPAVLDDPAVQDFLADIFGADKEAMKKIAMWTNIALSAVIAIAVGIAVSVGTSGTGAAAGIGLGIVIALAMAAPQTEAGIRESERTGVQAEAHRAGSEADKLKVTYTNLQEELKREMGFLRTAMESMMATADNTMKLFRSEQHALHSAATV